jgi:hypothetical protein
MARSKSPARSNSAAKSSNPLEDHMPIGIAIAIFAGLMYNTGASLADPKAWGTFLTGNWGGAAGVTGGFWDYSWLFTFHALNVAQNADGSYWMNSFINTFTAVFACNIANDVFFGNGISAAITNSATTTNIAAVFILWFITNNDYTAQYWGMVKSSPVGGALDIVLSTATVATIAAATTAAFGSVAAGSPTNLFGYFAIALPVFKATVVGSAGNVLPLDKGFSFEGGLDDAAERAFASAFYMGLGQYTGFLGAAAIAATTFGFASVTDGKFVVFATILFHLTVDLCPAMTTPLATIQDKIFEITKLNRN